MNLLKQLQTITFHRAFVDIGGSINAALMLSNALYWTNRLPDDRGGWFYKTRVEWEKETGLGRHEQDKARQQLADRGLIEVRRAKLAEGESVSVLWFRVCLDVLQERLTGDQMPESGNCQMPETGSTKCRKAAIALLIDKRTSITTSNTTPPTRARWKISMDWQPDTATVEALMADGITAEFIAQCVPEFRLYWHTRNEDRSHAAWQTAFSRQVRNQSAFQIQQDTRRHEHRNEACQSVPGHVARHPQRPRKESITERLERYERFAAGLDASIEATERARNASRTAGEAILGEFARH